MAKAILKQFDFLRGPRITHLPDKKIIKINIYGRFEDVLEPAYAFLFETYYQMDDVPKGPHQPPPLARYESPRKAPEDQKEYLNFIKNHKWNGFIGIPIPIDVTTLPLVENPNNLDAELSLLEYGKIAEILHKGPYEEEKPTIERLHRFIDLQGYEIIGWHEEEYLHGHGVLSAKPEDFRTIIRYQIKQKV